MEVARVNVRVGVLIWVMIIPMLPAEQLDSYIAGLILLAAAPCSGMVFVWSQLCRGDPYFTLSQVALNDAIMVVAFAPIVALLLGLSSITVPWDRLLTSVRLYILVPVILAQAWRKQLLSQGAAHFKRVTDKQRHLSESQGDFGKDYRSVIPRSSIGQ